MKTFISPLLIACLSAALLGEANAENHGSRAQVSAVISKSKDNSWSLTYSTQVPAIRIAFIRNPSDHRVRRWQPKDDGFEVVYLDGQEFIQRKDGAGFTEVTVSLTPTYVHLGKDYAPFSPFSDGGMLIHSGRFFACVNECGENTNGWPIKVNAPKGEFVIVDGELYQGSASWIGYNSGSKVYIGKQQPVKTNTFVGVFDQALPASLKTGLDQNIPKLMAYFSQHLGEIPGSKPMLYASYSNKPGGDSQGGTFAKQIFMHWDMDTLGQKQNDSEFVNRTLWFFAHEVAHFFQRGSEGEPLYGEQNQSWLHEGHAEYLAAQAVTALFAKQRSYVANKIEKMQSQCIEGLSQMALLDAAAKRQFRLYYSCGYFIHKSIDDAAKTKSGGEHSLHDVWQTFRVLVEKGGSSNAATLWQAASQFVPQETIELLQQLTESKLENPGALLKRLGALNGA